MVALLAIWLHLLAMVAPPNIWLCHYESNVGPNIVGVLVSCAPNNMVASTSYGCTLHIIWLRHLGHSKSNVGPHMVAQPKYSCATLNAM
jgi:hypothetical protein